MRPTRVIPYILLIAVAINAQFLSPYLNDPDLAIGYVDSCARFWFNSYDDFEGGFYTNVDREGDVVTAWGTNKNMLTQSRNAYGMARAFQLTGDTTFLEYMEGALGFQYDHAWDSQYGGWFSDLAQDGEVQGPQNNKTAFMQHYALLGPTVAWEVTRSPLHWQQIENGWNYLESNWYDDRTEFQGYYDESTRSHTNRWNKSFNATVDAMTTHLITLMLNTDDSRYQERYSEMILQARQHLVANMVGQAIGFPEHFDSNWNIQANETLTIMGHVLKTGWSIARLEQVAPEEGRIQDAETLVNNVLYLGYDDELGGPYKDYNRLTGVMQMWGNPDTAKAWWQMEQAVTAGLQLYDLTGQQHFLDMADETLHFFMRYFVDHTYGEVYENRTRYGEETWGTTKGNGYKGGYHSIELGYYTYLYGQLLIQNEPVMLHYYFEPLVVEQTVFLTPMALPFNELVITSVEHADTSYANYLSAERQIYLPEGVGGHFTVTFERQESSSVNDGVAALPTSATLSQNYPNPFNAATQIRILGPITAGETIQIFNLRGERIRSLPVDSPIIQWDGRDAHGTELVSGLYLSQLSSGSGPTLRMLLIR